MDTRRGEAELEQNTLQKQEEWAIYADPMSKEAEQGRVEGEAVPEATMEHSNCDHSND
jgi:hypothetical protein